MPTIKSYNKRLEAMKSERSSFIPYYGELSDYHLAHRGRFLASDRNKGHKRNTGQINNSSRLASRTLASGMMAGITSPARPWFRLSSGDKALDDAAAVKAWLHSVQMIMYRVYSSSNIYNVLHQLYSELGVFGTSVMGIYHDFDNVIWAKHYTVGSYMIGADGKNVIDSFYREYQVTVGQLVKQFGIENTSPHVTSMWNNGNSEAWIDIVHLIEPNDTRDNYKVDAKNKKYRSVYYEKSKGKGVDEDKFLRESGFDTFPIMSPRWDIAGEDIYATDCPGMLALGDTKALQLAERRKYQAIDKMVSPPLQGDVTLRNQMKGDTPSPNEVVWHSGGQDSGLTSIYGNYKPDIAVIISEIEKVESRISTTFYEDLFLMLAQSDRRQITAREVAEKHEEKLLMLGPVLERLHDELLDPLIDRTFDILQGAGVLPPPPPELQNKELSVEYVSILAQAQRLVNTGAIDRIVEFTSMASQIWPSARHKINANQSIDLYAEALGVDPAIVVSDVDAQAMADAEAAAAQQQMQADQVAQAADIAKKASETKSTGDNLLAAAANAG
jgi:hypothetical protein